MNKIAYLSLILIFAIHGICLSQVQRVRIIFESPTGYIRPLLLGFDPTNTATDGVDFGWDTLNFDDIPGDLNWLIEDDRYVVQGVGQFDNTKKYPFGLYLTYSGNFNIILDGLENFASEIEVYIYDAVLDTYTQINETDYTSYMLSGEYLYRYYIAFTQPELSLNENQDLRSKIVFLRDSREVLINTYNSAIIDMVSIYNVLGQKIVSRDQINNSELKIPINSVNSNVLLVKVKTNKGTISKKLIVE